MQRFLNYRSSGIYLLLILIIGAFMRLNAVNWDQGFHLHPDERAIVMFTTPLQFPKSLPEFLSPASPWNPHFFAYGNLPLYLLNAAGNIASIFDPRYATYDRINLIGRFLSALSDVGTIIVVFFLGKKLFGKTVGITAAFFYAISVLPIQLSHFYAVDTLLTFFVLLTLYQLFFFYEKPTIKRAILVGFFFGLSLATKTSATVLIVALGAVIFADFLLIFLKNPHRPHVWFPHIPKLIKTLVTYGVIIIFITIITFIFFEPYALIDFKSFWQQTMQQHQMTYDPFTFPYTLQYVGKIPYFYELKNIFLWGQGPILATLSFLGAIYFTFLPFKVTPRRSPVTPPRWPNGLLGGGGLRAQSLIVLCFFWIYFFVIGKFAVGWMRYMLPLYPLFAIFAAVFFLRILGYLGRFSKLFAICYLLFAILWPLSFMHIYTKPNTRVLASEWIYKNIPPNSIIAREHWDDGMPIGGNISYKTLELPIYEMEDPLIERQIYQTLQETDYIIIASNRLYTPLQRISKNCQKWNLPQERCTNNANRYYKKLFNGELGYTKVAEFSVFPKLEIRNLKLEIDDSSADESFTIYDHPKVMIFNKRLF